MHRGVQQSNHLILVRRLFFSLSRLLARSTPCQLLTTVSPCGAAPLETLTPIDQPLDKLEDLTPRERSV